MTVNLEIVENEMSRECGTRMREKKYM